MGAQLTHFCPPLRPTFAVRETQSLGQQMLDATVGINGLNTVGLSLLGSLCSFLEATATLCYLNISLTNSPLLNQRMITENNTIQLYTTVRCIHKW